MAGNKGKLLANKRDWKREEKRERNKYTYDNNSQTEKNTGNKAI